MSLKKEALEFVRSQGRGGNFTLKLYKSYMAKYEGKDFSSGYFDYPEINEKLKGKPLLAVGTGKRPVKEWVCTLLHEYCHYTQYKEQSKEWVAYYNSYQGKKPDLKKCLMASVNLEADCERRTVKLIKKLGLDKYIDLKEYAQNANAYLCFYFVYSKTQKWYQKAPFSIKEITSKMPKTIQNPMDLKPDSKMMGLYIEKCYKDDWAKGLLDG